MKKVIGVLAALCVMAGSVFARGVYDGEIQLHLGVGLDSVAAEKSVSESGITTTTTSEFGDTTFDFDLETWHLFNFNDVFGLGFMVGFNGGVGGTTKMTTSFSNSAGGSGYVSMPSDKLDFACHFNGIIGPAVGINLGNIVKFDIALGMAYGFSMFAYTDDSATRNKTAAFLVGGVGFGTEVQAKFVPASPVSPVIGYRLAIIPSKTGVTIGSNSTTETYDSVAYVNNEIYVGISFNW